MLFAVTTITDIAIAWTLIEGALLLVFHYRTGRGLAPQDYLLNLIAGLCLMLALRAALASLWMGVPVFLMLSGVAHGGDIHLRLRHKRHPGTK